MLINISFLRFKNPELARVSVDGVVDGVVIFAGILKFRFFN